MDDSLTQLSVLNEEIRIWREDFLGERFCSPPFKFIPDKDKDYIRNLFLSCPSSSFKSPWLLWNDCVSVLLQKKDEK